MTRGPDPNRWVPPEPEAEEQDAVGERNSPESHTARWLIVIGLVVLVLVVVLATL